MLSRRGFSTARLSSTRPASSLKQRFHNAPWWCAWTLPEASEQNCKLPGAVPPCAESSYNRDGDGPTLRHVDLFGTDLASGKPLRERLEP